MNSPTMPQTATLAPLDAWLREHLPGLALAGLVAAAGSWGAQLPWLANHGISALTLAIVLGMLGAGLHAALPSTHAGVGFAKARLLRVGIVLYGLRLTFQDIGHVGVAGVAIDALVLGSTFAIATFVGTRGFGMDRTTAMLIGAGSSICGAAAVLATEPVVKGRPDQVAVAVATVVVFGTTAIFLYPALYHFAAAHFGAGEQAFGLYTGSTVHEVAQVVAAGQGVSQAAADTAVIAKMVRVMMLAPFLLALSLFLARPAAGTPAPAGRRAPITIPWFALGFVAMAGFNSLHLLTPALTHAATDLDTSVLAMAMAALGLTTHASAIRAAGLRPLALAGLLFGWLIGGGALINAAVHALLG
ncbi:MAG: YeiH family putative sulfate export transporter [Pelomonas sp.]|nr:YeiH family putative sulfate export transporter [Roseateles sp.]